MAHYIILKEKISDYKTDITNPHCEFHGLINPQDGSPLMDEKALAYYVEKLYSSAENLCSSFEKLSNQNFFEDLPPEINNVKREEIMLREGAVSAKLLEAVGLVYCHKMGALERMELLLEYGFIFTDCQYLWAKNHNAVLNITNNIKYCSEDLKTVDGLKHRCILGTKILNKFLNKKGGLKGPILSVLKTKIDAVTTYLTQAHGSIVQIGNNWIDDIKEWGKARNIPDFFPRKGELNNKVYDSIYFSRKGKPVHKFDGKFLNKNSFLSNWMMHKCCLVVAEALPPPKNAIIPTSLSKRKDPPNNQNNSKKRRKLKVTLEGGEEGDKEDEEEEASSSNIITLKNKKEPPIIQNSLRVVTFTNNSSPSSRSNAPSVRPDSSPARKSAAAAISSSPLQIQKQSGRSKIELLSAAAAICSSPLKIQEQSGRSKIELLSAAAAISSSPLKIQEQAGRSKIELLSAAAAISSSPLKIQEQAGRSKIELLSAAAAISSSPLKIQEQAGRSKTTSNNEVPPSAAAEGAIDDEVVMDLIDAPSPLPEKDRLLFTYVSENGRNFRRFGNNIIVDFHESLLRRLEPGRYLDDEMVNLGIQHHLMERVEEEVRKHFIIENSTATQAIKGITRNSFYENGSKIVNWYKSTARKPNKVDPFSLRYMVFEICDKGHFSLLCITNPSLMEDFWKSVLVADEYPTPSSEDPLLTALHFDSILDSELDKDGALKCTSRHEHVVHDIFSYLFYQWEYLHRPRFLEKYPAAVSKLKLESQRLKVFLMAMKEKYLAVPHTPQQSASSMDCGFFTIAHFKQLTKNLPNMSEATFDQLKQGRGYIFDYSQSSIALERSEKYPQLVQLLKERYNNTAKQVSSSPPIDDDPMLLPTKEDSNSSSSSSSIEKDDDAILMTSIFGSKSPEEEDAEDFFSDVNSLIHSKKYQISIDDDNSPRLTATVDKIGHMSIQLTMKDFVASLTSKVCELNRLEAEVELATLNAFVNFYTEEVKKDHELSLNTCLLIFGVNAIQSCLKAKKDLVVLSTMSSKAFDTKLRYEMWTSLRSTALFISCCWDYLHPREASDEDFVVEDDNDDENDDEKDDDDNVVREFLEKFTEFKDIVQLVDGPEIDHMVFSAGYYKDIKTFGKPIPVVVLDDNERIPKDTVNKALENLFLQNKRKKSGKSSYLSKKELSSKFGGVSTVVGKGKAVYNRFGDSLEDQEKLQVISDPTKGVLTRKVVEDLVAKAKKEKAAAAYNHDGGLEGEEEGDIGEAEFEEVNSTIIESNNKNKQQDNSSSSSSSSSTTTSSSHNSIMDGISEKNDKNPSQHNDPDGEIPTPTDEEVDENSSNPLTIKLAKLLKENSELKLQREKEESERVSQAQVWKAKYEEMVLQKEKRDKEDEERINKAKQEWEDKYAAIKEENERLKNEKEADEAVRRDAARQALEERKQSEQKIKELQKLLEDNGIKFGTA